MNAILIVSYADIITEEGALSSGGCGCSYRFFHKEREYLVEDTYCPNPNCSCAEVHVKFWECITRAHDGSQRVTLEQCFVGKVTLKGRIEIVETGACEVAAAEQILSVWWKRYRHDLPMLKGRYQDVKEIGQRSLDAQAPPLAGLGTPPDDPMRFDQSLGSDQVLREPPQGGQVRPGRNDPCPCGSGKKYKNCCWRESR